PLRSRPRRRSPRQRSQLPGNTEQREKHPAAAAFRVEVSPLFGANRKSSDVPTSALADSAIRLDRRPVSPKAERGWQLMSLRHIVPPAFSNAVRGRLRKNSRLPSAASAY